MLTVFFYTFLILAGFSHSIPIEEESGNVGIEMPVPRGLTREQYSQTIIDYWTPERMASAIPLDALVVDEGEALSFDNAPKVQRAASVLVSSDLHSGMTSTKPKVAGKVYFSVGTSNYICSGSVVNAPNRDTVLTAGHCVFDNDKQIWATNWVFVPEYSLGSRPSGTFTARKMATKTKWMSNRDFNHDVGLVVMNVNDKGQHVQDVAGGLGITIDAPKDAQTTSFGYPKNLNSGETVSNCPGTSSGLTNVSGFNGLQLSCAMTGGSSGGPWIQQYSVNSRTGQQVSVNSFIITNRPNIMYGPHFIHDNIGTLYNEYKAQ